MDRKVYYQKNKDHINAMQKQYRQTDKWKETRRKYNERTKERRKELQQEYRVGWLEVWKNNNLVECSECGYDECFEAIDFHHTKKKEFYPTQFTWNRKPSRANIEKVLAEIEGCIPLCANCHRKLHFTR